MSNAVVAPVLLPLFTALALLPFADRPRVQQGLSLASGAALLAAAVGLVVATAGGQVLVLPIGSWAPTLGIVWVVDRLTALMLLLAAASSLATLVYAPPALASPEAARWFFPLHQLLVLGVDGAFVTGDLFNLFVFFEILLVSSFVLIALGGRPAQLQQTFPYVVINLVGSALLFGGVGVVYATAGTVNMAELSGLLRAGPMPPAFWGGLVLVLIVFGVKAAVVPFFSWLPDSYPQAVLPVSAFFAGLLTKVGVYTLFRSVTLFGSPIAGPLHTTLLVLSAATMLIGVVGALGRGTIRGILSFHIVSQVGYMVFGLALLTPVGLAAGLFYVTHHILVKTALFLAGGLAEQLGGGGELGRVRGLASSHPWAAVSFLVPALALAGIPPLSGFWGKLFLLVAGFQRGAYVTTAIALVVSLLTLASMLKIWFATFWGKPTLAPGGWGTPGGAAARLGPPLSLAVLSLLVGLASPLVWGHAERTAVELLDGRPYMTRVLGAEGRRAPPVGEGS